MYWMLDWNDTGIDPIHTCSSNGQVVTKEMEICKHSRMREELSSQS